MVPTIDRRTMLKILLAAGGGLAASAFLPSKWTKPLVKTGVLPVHAQLSGCTPIIRTAIVNTVTFTNTADEFSFPFEEGDILGSELKSCDYTRLTLSWNSGNNTPSDRVSLQLKITDVMYTPVWWLDPDKPSPLVNNGISAIAAAVPQLVGLTLRPDDITPGVVFPYSWNAGTVTLTFT